jgi:hypothetical protein
MNKKHFCCDCGSEMEMISREAFLGRDCLGDHTETHYYWKCKCGKEERKYNSWDSDR